MSHPDADKGLLHKYNVERTDGKPLGAVFVLAEHDKYAVDALKAYAVACRLEFPELSEDLWKMAYRWEQRQESK